MIITQQGMYEAWAILAKAQKDVGTAIKIGARNIEDYLAWANEAHTFTQWAYHNAEVK